MKKYKFKTNINCGGCIANVTPYLDKVAGIEKWEVDTKNKDKILTVEGDASKETIESAVKEAGYNIEEEKSGFLGRMFG